MNIFERSRHIHSLCDALDAFLAGSSAPLETREQLSELRAAMLELLREHGGVYQQLTQATAQNLELTRALEFERRCSEQLAQGARQIEAFARRDSLTGLLNRSYLSTIQFPLNAVILIDLDRFKPVNDRFGHDVGDRFLVCFARFLEASLRSKDLVIRYGEEHQVVRYGGEEFLVILTEGEARELAARLVRACSEHSWRELDLTETQRSQRLGDNPAGLLTISAGIARVQPGDTLETLIARADSALLGAKTSRNTFVDADESMNQA